jgi:purine-nucleoside phosphorylase
MSLTPHNNAKPEDVADILIMPGDPLRAKFIAYNYLEDAVLINKIRNMLGYTGSYKGLRITVHGSGMGIPSMAIYAHEMYTFYNVSTIIRVGTIGGMADDVELRDIIIGMAACTDSSFLNYYGLSGYFAPTANYGLLRIAAEEAEKMKVPCHVGSILTTDRFYSISQEATEKWRDMGVIGVEMETAGLYAEAASLNKKAISIFTVSDHIFKGTKLSPEEREIGFDNMVQIALETALRSKEKMI